MASIYVGNRNLINVFDASSGGPTGVLRDFGPNDIVGVLLSSGTLYVASVKSPFAGQVNIGTYNATTGAVINPSLLTVPGVFKNFQLSSGVLYVAVVNGGRLVVNAYTAATGAATGTPVSNDILGDFGGFAVG